MYSFNEPIELNHLTQKDHERIKKMEYEYKKLPVWNAFDFGAKSIKPTLSGTEAGIRINFLQDAPENALNIKKFIDLVKVEEAKYTGAEANTIYMLTVLRKIFYDTPGWDNYLIRGVGDIKSPYGPGPCTLNSRTRVRIPFFPSQDFYINDMVCYPQDPVTKKPPEIVMRQEIAVTADTLNMKYSDIAHTLCGLDAFNHSHEVKLPGIELGLDSNIHAVTWLGDLGSVLAEAVIEYVNRIGSFSMPGLQYFIDKFAGTADMLGNIEPYNIYHEFSEQIKDSSMKVSDILHDYYLGKDASVHQKQRFLQFAKGLGATLDATNRKITNRNFLKQNFSQQIGTAGAFYIMANAEITKKNFGSVVAFAIAVANHSAAVLLSEALLQAIEDALP
jgi:hypothetical protein